MFVRVCVCVASDQLVIVLLVVSVVTCFPASLVTISNFISSQTWKAKTIRPNFARQE